MHMLLPALLLAAAVLAGGESAFSVTGTLDLAIPHGTTTGVGFVHRVGLTTMLDGVVVDQVLVTPTSVRWDDNLHGLRVELPATQLRMAPRATVVVGWAVEATLNGAGPWFGGRWSHVCLKPGKGGVVLSAACATMRIAEAAKEPPSVFDPVQVKPTIVKLELADGPVSCRVLAAKGSSPGLIIAFGFGAGDAASCIQGLGMWWSGAPRAGWTVAAPEVRGSTRWADAPPAVTGALVEALVARLACDPARVVVAGASNGGSAALALLAAHPQRVRAALAFPGTLDQVPSAAGIPVWLRWGAGDSQDWRVQAGRSADLLAKAGARVDRAEMAGGHVPPVTGPEMLSWLAVVAP